MTTMIRAYRTRPNPTPGESVPVQCAHNREPSNMAFAIQLTSDDISFLETPSRDQKRSDLPAFWLSRHEATLAALINACRVVISVYTKGGAKPKPSWQPSQPNRTGSDPLSDGVRTPSRVLWDTGRGGVHLNPTPTGLSLFIGREKVALSSLVYSLTSCCVVSRAEAMTASSMYSV